VAAREIGSPWPERRSRRGGYETPGEREANKEKELYPKLRRHYQRASRWKNEEVSLLAAQTTTYCLWKLPPHWHVFNNALTWLYLSALLRLSFRYTAQPISLYDLHIFADVRTNNIIIIYLKY